MSNDKDRQVLCKMLERIERVITYCNGLDFEAFQANVMLQEACVFNIVQIGELAKQGLSDEIVAAHPDIPWRQIYGMRNRIVHGYEGVLLRIVWETIADSFPVLRNELLPLLQNMR